MSLAYWILILNIWIIFEPTSLQTESSTVLREGDLKDYAIELNATNFDGVLNDTPATYAIVEFYAHWCYVCRIYKPHYEKIASLFNGPDAVHPGIVLMTRIDCALKMNAKLCSKFSAVHYPILLWGPPSKFVLLSSSDDDEWEPNQANSEIRVIDDRRTAGRLLDWINNQIGSSYGLDDEKLEIDQRLPSNIMDIPNQQIARAVNDAEEAATSLVGTM